MARKSIKPAIILTDDEIDKLQKLANARTEEHRKVVRAKILILNHEGLSNKEIASSLSINRHTVELTLSKCLHAGLSGALLDIPRTGRNKSINDKEKAWVVSISDREPAEFGLPGKSWSITQLLSFIRSNCIEAGCSSLANLSRSKLWAIIEETKSKPQLVNYLVVKQDTQTSIKMYIVLYIYRKMEWISPMSENPSVVSLLAGVDMHDGHISALASDTYKSNDFISFLKTIDNHYPKAARIHIISDYSNQHVTKEIMVFLKTRPNRFEFDFTPQNPFCLDLVESLYYKLLKTAKSEINASSKSDFTDQLLIAIARYNQIPSVQHWSIHQK